MVGQGGHLLHLSQPQQTGRGPTGGSPQDLHAGAPARNRGISTPLEQPHLLPVDAEPRRHHLRSVPPGPHLGVRADGDGGKVPLRLLPAVPGTGRVSPGVHRGPSNPRGGLQLQGNHPGRQQGHSFLLLRFYAQNAAHHRGRGSSGPEGVDGHGA